VPGAQCKVQEQRDTTRLALAAKDVRVVLLEAANPGKAAQSTLELVAVQHTEIGHANRQLAPRTHRRAKHEAVAGTVHRLQRVLFVVAGLKHEHVVLVVLVMPADAPQVRVVDVGRDDLAQKQ